MKTIGPLLEDLLTKIDNKPESERHLLAAMAGSSDGSVNTIPVILQIPEIQVEIGEQWIEYKSRVLSCLEPLIQTLKSTMGIQSEPLITANALSLSASPEQIYRLGEDSNIRYLELNLAVNAQQMDDSVKAVEHDQFIHRHPNRTGTGVKVAVLDSGIDIEHPWLNVTYSISTCGESVDIPGNHGTHCAGAIASKDSVFPGIAPDVTLLNIKPRISS